jgi:hypothetical protein
LWVRLSYFDNITPFSQCAPIIEVNTCGKFRISFTP